MSQEANAKNTDAEPTAPRPQPTRAMRLLWRLMRGDRLLYIFALIALLGQTIAGYLGPMIPAMVIDGLIQEDLSNAPAFTERLMTLLGGRAHLVDRLWIPAAVLVGVVGVSGLLMYLRQRWAAAASESITRRVRDRLYDHLQKLPTTYHDHVETGDVVQRCTSDVETLRMFLSMQVVEVGRAAAMLTFVVPFMLWLKVEMTLVTLAVLPVIVVFALVFFYSVKRLFKQADEAEGALTARLQENLTGIRVVRAFHRQAHEIDKFAQANREHRDRDYRVWRVMAYYWSSSDFLCFMQLGLVLVVGGYWVRQDLMTPGALFAFLAYVNMMLWPVRQLGRVLSEFGKALVALGRIGEVLDEPEESATSDVEDDGPGVGVLPEAGPGRIVCDGLTFGYDPRRPALRDVSFTLEAGQTLALLGPSGSGKSTLIALLLRLYDYDIGRIELDGVEIRRAPRRAVRGRFGVVMQEPFLFSKTVRENIRLGEDHVGEDKVIDAATIACIHDSVVEFEAGYDTLIGERGVRLSGGQRQRLAIARAVARDARILVLDDALSAVDTNTERAILDALRRRRGRQSTIVIAHRLSTLMQADQILVLDHGRVVQRGTHETLVNEEGMYRRLWNIQTELADDLETELAVVGGRAADEADADAGRGEGG